MIKYIVEGKRWFDKVNGNTYHSVSITNARTNTLMHHRTMIYGYGDQYRHTALSWLIGQCKFKSEDRFNHELIRSMIYFNVVDVPRKKDL